MRKAYHKVQQRWWVVVVLGLTLVLAACGGGGEKNAGGPTPEPSLDEKMQNYTNSLLEEYEWLSDRVEDARIDPQPSGALCEFPDFGHQPVVLDRETLKDVRRDDPTVESLVDYLKAAAGDIGIAREEYQRLCNSWSNAGESIANMQPRLQNAQNLLNYVNDQLYIRANPPQEEIEGESQ